MLEYLHSRPLLRAAIVIIAGIAVGGSAGIPLSLSLFGYAIPLYTLAAGMALLSLLLAVVLRGRSVASSVAILLAAFAFGIFLINYDEVHHPERDATSTSSRKAAIGETRVDTLAMECRETLSEAYFDSGVQGDEYAIVAAMTLGERSRVDWNLRQTYNYSGTSHIFALSGLHLGIIFMLLSCFLPRQRYPILSTIVLLVALWCYVVMVGFHASLLRAAVMLSLYTLCSMAVRRVDRISVFVLSALLLLLVSPQWLFDVGFQMSFTAVLFIILLGHPWRKVIPYAWFQWLRYPVDITWLALSAGLGTAPLVAHYFHRFSAISLLANVVVSPCAVMLIFFAVVLLLCVLLASWLPFLSFLVPAAALPLSFTARFLNSFVSWVASLPFSSVDGIFISAAQTVVIYLLIAIICLVIRYFWKRYPHVESTRF